MTTHNAKKYFAHYYLESYTKFMQKHTILCVDDEIDNTEALERLFRKKFTVLKANSGKEALSILDQNRDIISVIITDQRMPEMTGVEFLAQTIEKCPDTIRILLTGYTDVESIIEAVNKGEIYRYLTKPWDPVDLLNTVEKAAELYSIKKELKEKNIELTHALEELKTLDKAKSNFMILINHELKTPLTSILNFISLLSESKLSDDQSLYVDRIKKSSDRLHNIIEDVLIIMRAETKQLRVQHEPVSYATCQGEITQETNAYIKQKNQKLIEKTEALIFKTDPRLLKEIIRRLLHNAAKFGNEYSNIVFESHKTDHGIEFIVENDGPKISDQTIMKITKPFYLDENVMNHSSGMGLGLTIAQGLLKELGSNLKIQNTNTGVRVSFILPI